MADPGTDLQARVLAWIAETGRGYKAAGKEFGLPYATVKGWAQAARSGAPPPKPNARTRARAEQAQPAVPDPSTEPAWDPTTCTREEFLAEGLRRCMAGRAAALGQGHGGVARQWEITLADYRRELDKLREEERRKAEARGKIEDVDVDALIGRLLRVLPRLARAAPERAREIWLELGRAIGEHQELPGDPPGT